LPSSNLLPAVTTTSSSTLIAADALHVVFSSPLDAQITAQTSIFTSSTPGPSPTPSGTSSAATGNVSSLLQQTIALPTTNTPINFSLTPTPSSTLDISTDQGSGLSSTAGEKLVNNLDVLVDPAYSTLLSSTTTSSEATSSSNTLITTTTVIAPVLAITSTPASNTMSSSAPTSIDNATKASGESLAINNASPELPINASPPIGKTTGSNDVPVSSVDDVANSAASEATAISGGTTGRPTKASGESLEMNNASPELPNASPPKGKTKTTGSDNVSVPSINDVANSAASEVTAISGGTADRPTKANGASLEMNNASPELPINASPPKGKTKTTGSDNVSVSSINDVANSAASEATTFSGGTTDHPTKASGASLEMNNASPELPINASPPEGETKTIGSDNVSVSSINNVANSAASEATTISGGTTQVVPVPPPPPQGGGLQPGASQLGSTGSAPFTAPLIETDTTVTGTAILAAATPTALQGGGLQLAPPQLGPPVSASLISSLIEIGTAVTTTLSTPVLSGIPPVYGGSQLDSYQLGPSVVIPLAPATSSLADLGTSTIITTDAVTSTVPVAIYDMGTAAPYTGYVAPCLFYAYLTIPVRPAIKRGLPSSRGTLLTLPLVVPQHHFTRRPRTFLLPLPSRYQATRPTHP
jgi:hypothetical protein